MSIAEGTAVRPRVGVVAIRKSRELLDQGQADDEFMRSFGQNTGNLLFTNAVYRHLAAETIHLGFRWNPAQAADLDAIVIPAANWVNDREDWGFLADLLEQADKPTIMIGLGAQAASTESPPRPPAGTVRFLEAVSGRSAAISTRDQFTAEVLASMGFDRTVVTGCPSLFWHGARSLVVPPPRGTTKRPLALHGTRYGVPRLVAGDRQRWFYAQAFATGSLLVLQSELPELLMVLRGVRITDPDLQQALIRYYGAPRWSVLEDYLRSQAIATLDVDEWIDAMSRASISFGTRLHSTILALIAGVPAVLATHDTRTRGVADYAGIPTIGVERIDPESRLRAAGVRRIAHPGEFNHRHPATIETYRRFLAMNGLELT